MARILSYKQIEKLHLEGTNSRAISVANWYLRQTHIKINALNIQSKSRVWYICILSAPKGYSTIMLRFKWDLSDKYNQIVITRDQVSGILYLNRKNRCKLLYKFFSMCNYTQWRNESNSPLTSGLWLILYQGKCNFIKSLNPLVILTEMFCCNMFWRTLTEISAVETYRALSWCESDCWLSCVRTDLRDTYCDGKTIYVQMASVNIWSTFLKTSCGKLWK